MSEEFSLNNEIFEENEDQKMGSLYHSAIQAKLTCLLGIDDRFIVFTELSLDISLYDFSRYDIKAKDEIKPDICLFSNDLHFPERDIIKMTEIPLEFLYPF